MTYSSSLADDSIPLIIDTSVLINLHASTHGRRILAAVPNDVLVPEIVAAELEHETSKVNGEHQFIQELATSGKVRLVALSEPEYEVYATLVSGTSSLGDGEAATIAVAACRHHLPVIDERKGRLRAQALCAGRLTGWSLDLFRHPRVVAALGAADAIDALYLALRDGRMRIHEDHCDHVVDLIGVQHALECNCLPSYKTRRGHWQELVSRREVSDECSRP
tara:strand:+ start:3864 stop:4526 length:663 start_codon:yes stop_codon:yes gene_type:complete